MSFNTLKGFKRKKHIFLENCAALDCAALDWMMFGRIDRYSRGEKRVKTSISQSYD